jgi:hypothetical protein
LALLGVAPLPMAAADLARIDRTIAKEPRYQSGAPRYCLLVFGPDAGMRAWLVQDGPTLYVDRHANGDLTQPGNKVAAVKGEYTDPAEGIFYFEAGDIYLGARVHKNLGIRVYKLNSLAESDDEARRYLAADRQARVHQIRLDVDMPGWKGTGLGGRVHQDVSGRDGHGFLRFADRPQDAPVIHFGGPWQITLSDPPRLRVGRTANLFLELITPGLGPGTTSHFAYEGLVPPAFHPTVDITYPVQRAGETPFRERYELKHRC